MKKIIFVLLILLSGSLFSIANAQTIYSPIGYWKTIDDVTGKPKAIVEIWQQSDSTLSGRIIKLFPRPGYDQYSLCKACEGELHNQRIVGMVFLKNLVQSQNDSLQWAKGEILDPKNGKIYQSSLRLSKNGQNLLVRGYIGLPLFGRTQTWVRISDLENA